MPRHSLLFLDHGVRDEAGPSMSHKRPSTGHLRGKPWDLALLLSARCSSSFALLVLIQLMAPAIAAWNVSCPKPCQCQLQTSDFTHKSALRTVNCSYQRLKVVPTDLPKDSEALLLGGNSLGDLYDHVPNLINLKELDVTNNKVRSLGRSYNFHSLSSLTYLGLAKNELTSLTRDVFNGLVNLQVLLLAENQIQYIEDQAFHGLNSLQTLDLGRNQLSSLYPEWFYGLSTLRELYLYENRIHLINSASFRPLKRLQHLSLHTNRISHVSNDGFWGLDVLDILHLERNYLKEVPTKALQLLPSLQMLYLSGNPFAMLRQGALADLPVEELALNSLPSLTLVEAAAFRNLTRLVTLQLRDCPKLAYIDPQAFVNVTVLRHLNLQNNRLRTVPRETAKSLPNRCELMLRGNPFLCDCNVRWIQQELELDERNESRIALPDPDQLVCDSPEHAHGTSIRLLDPQTALPPQCAPSILPLMDSSIEKRLGDPLGLDCRAVGIPTPTLTWILPGGRTLSETSNEIRIQFRRTGTLVFYHLKEEDAGNYTCVADNSLGRARFNVTLSVKRIDIHIFPIGISSNFVTVVWNGTARDSFPQFQILYRLWPAGAPRAETKLPNVTSQTYEHVTVSPYHRSYTIPNLRPESTYEVCIAFQDRDGYYVQISCTVVRTQDADYPFQGIHRTSNVAVAVVLGIVVTMVMVICLVTVAARKYRQRQYICPDKPIVHRMSHIPLENLYSPLMSNAGP